MQHGALIPDDDEDEESEEEVEEEEYHGFEDPDEH